MTRKILLAMAGVPLLAACGQPEVDNNVAANDAVAANKVVEAAPVNAVDGNVSQAGNSSAPAMTVSPEPRVAPAPDPRTAPGAERQIMPLERRVDRVEPAPKQEPAPTPTSNCTPEHEAMGHCKQ